MISIVKFGKIQKIQQPLALKTYKPWVQYFFRDSHSDEHASYLEGPSPLAASVAPIALVWTYIN